MLEGRNLFYRYKAGGPAIINGMSIAVPKGQITGLTGPSGSGKSTLARLLSGHMTPEAGDITIDGEPHRPRGLNPVQLLAQTPIFAVNPRWTIGKILTEAWQPDSAIREGLGVKAEWYERFPHELSGGELQRVAVLRALAPEVRYLVADEISAMLDSITQLEIWTFLRTYIRQREIGILAISHDRALLDRIAGTVLETN